MPVDVVATRHTARQLVGRAAELRALARSIAGLTEGRGSFVAISGEVGIGKTRLLEEAVALAAGAGVRVAGAVGCERPGDRRYGTIASALDPLVTELAPSRLRRIDATEAAQLCTIFPAVGRRLSLAPARRAEHWWVHRALRRLLAELGDDAPALVTLDDVHEADAATIDLLAHLLPRGPIPGVLLAIAYRGERLSGSARRAADVAAHEGHLAQLEPQGLTEREAAALAGSGTDRATCRLLFDESGGNPFVLEQLALELERSRRTSVRSADDLALSEPVRSALTEELVGLGPRSRSLLWAGSALGTTFDVHLAAEIAGVPEALALVAYDDLASGEIIVPGSTPSTVSFRHPVQRRVVYEGMALAERRRLHRQALRILTDRGASLPDLAGHAARSATRGDRDAIELLIAAATATAGRAPADAAAWLECAWRLLGADAPAEQRLDLLVALARALETTGRLEESRAWLIEALALAEGSQAHRHASLLIQLATLAVRLGSPSESRLILEQELTRVTERRDAYALHVALAAHDLLTGELGEATRLGERALALAYDLGDDGEAFALAALLGCVHCYCAASDRARSQVEEALAVYGRLADNDVAPRLDAVVQLGATLQTLECYADAARVYERGLDVARRADAVRHVQHLVSYLAVVRSLQGRLFEAAELLGEAGDVLVSGDDESRLYGLVATAWNLLKRGDVDTALTVSQDAAELARGPMSGSALCCALTVHGAALLEVGRPRRAVEAVTESGGGPQLGSIPPAFRPRWFGLLTRAELNLGRIDAATAAVKRAEAAAARTGLAGALGYARRARGELALALGETVIAAALAQEAGRLHLQVGLRVDAAQDGLVAGEALVAAGRVDTAVDELQRSHALARDAGASRLRDQAECALARLGVRADAHRAPHVDAVARLTPRERDVAALVAQGLRNREIAAALHISHRTVERYVTSTCRKLGADRRSQLASIVARNAELRADEP